MITYTETAFNMEGRKVEPVARRFGLLREFRENGLI